jgi:hypothetical protein
MRRRGAKQRLTDVEDHVLVMNRVAVALVRAIRGRGVNHVRIGERDAAR